MAFVARGRGIGRGRGFGIPKAQTRPGEDSDGQKNTSSESAHATEEFDLSKHLCDLRESNLDDKGEQLSKYISSSDSSTKIKQVVDLLCQRTMTDSDFAPLAAKVASKLCCEESCGSAFRSCLLKNTQENYKNRASIREKSLGKWFGLVGLICEFFNHLRTGEAPLKPLAGAAFQTMSELLREEDAANERQDVEEDEIDCFYQHFKTVGQLLESVDQGKMDELVGKIRDTILAAGTTAKTRCLLLELLELQARHWKISKELECYYCDMLTEILNQQV